MRQPKPVSLKPTRPSSGNFVSEWLGHRIFPNVRLHGDYFAGPGFGTCPFISAAVRETTRCIKPDNSFGVCTVNSPSNGLPQDWLACPYRVISSTLVKDACARIFNLTKAYQPVPVTLFASRPELQKFKDAIATEGVGYAFFQEKLGGEISVISTPKSPEMAFDVTLVEIRREKRRFVVARYGILELQTMDFHGSYKRAATNLMDGLRLHKAEFPNVLTQNLRWAAEGVEGPNIANVFKRTFYQVLLKFQLAGQGAAAGTILAIPQAVWDSWQPFLGAPELEQIDAMTYGIKAVDDLPTAATERNAQICIFDIDATAEEAISPVKVKLYIRVSADQLAHHAFRVVPTGMLKSLSASDSIMLRIKDRLSRYWPGITTP
jgi:hypothetical protein